MRSLFRWTAAPAVAIITAACAGPATTGGAETASPAPAQTAPSPAPAAAASGPASVYDGVYTAAQADRGEAVTLARCSACHSPGPEWGGGRLLLSYDGRPAWELVSMLRATMPMDAPGSLTLQEYTDVVTYILELNEIPAGNTELAGEESRLQEVTLEYRR